MKANANILEHSGMPEKQLKNLNSSISLKSIPDIYFREDLRKSFARSNTISSASADTKEGGEEWKEKGEGASATVSNS